MYSFVGSESRDSALKMVHNHFKLTHAQVKLHHLSPRAKNEISMYYMSIDNLCAIMNMYIEHIYIYMYKLVYIYICI